MHETHPPLQLKNPEFTKKPRAIIEALRGKTIFEWDYQRTKTSYSTVILIQAENYKHLLMLIAMIQKVFARNFSC